MKKGQLPAVVVIPILTFFLVLIMAIAVLPPVLNAGQDVVTEASQETELTELWYNTSFTYCRTLSLNHDSIYPRVNEPIDRLIDSSAWSNKPYNDSVRVINSSCNSFQSGDVEIRNVVYNITQTAGVMDSFNLVFPANVGNTTNETYSIYYDSETKGETNYDYELHLMFDAVTLENVSSEHLFMKLGAYNGDGEGAIGDLRNTRSDNATNWARSIEGMLVGKEVGENVDFQDRDCTILANYSGVYEFRCSARHPAGDFTIKTFKVYWFTNFIDVSITKNGTGNWGIVQRFSGHIEKAYINNTVIDLVPDGTLYFVNLNFNNISLWNTTHDYGIGMYYKDGMGVPVGSNNVTILPETAFSYFTLYDRRVPLVYFIPTNEILNITYGFTEYNNSFGANQFSAMSGDPLEFNQGSEETRENIVISQLPSGLNVNLLLGLIVAIFLIVVIFVFLVKGGIT